MQRAGEKVVGAGGKENSDERKQIRGGNHAAFFFRARAVLDQGVERHGEETAEKSEQCEMRAGALNCVAGIIKQRAKDGHAERAERDQAVFDFAAGEIPGDEAAHSDADSDRGLEIADVRFVHAQDVVAVNDDGELQQSGEEPKVGVAPNGPTEDAVGENRSHLNAEFAERIPAEFLGRVCRGHARDAEACRQAYERAAEQHQACQAFTPAKLFGEKTCGHHGGNAADERAELENSVTPGKPPLRQKFRKKAIFRGPEERRLRADQKDGGALEGQVVHGQACDSHAHDQNFHQLCADHHAAFAVTVGEISAGKRKEYKRESEEGADDEHEKVALLLAEIQGEDDVNDQELDGIVVECVLELGDDQAPEAALPVAFGERCRGCGVFVH